MTFLNAQGLLFRQATADAEAELARIPAELREAERLAAKNKTTAASTSAEPPRLRGGGTAVSVDGKENSAAAHEQLSRIYLWMATPEGAAALGR